MALFPQPQQTPASYFLQAALGNPQQAGMQLMQSNSEFAGFMNRNRGKSPQQILSEHLASHPGMTLQQMAAQRGIDYDTVRRIFGR